QSIHGQYQGIVIRNAANGQGAGDRVRSPGSADARAQEGAAEERHPAGRRTRDGGFNEWPRRFTRSTRVARRRRSALAKPESQELASTAETKDGTWGSAPEAVSRHQGRPEAARSEIVRARRKSGGACT